MKSGREEGIPYSLSRWTDVPGDPSKWLWFRAALKAKKMIAFDPRTAVPCEWSLKPEDTLGLVFWTKDPTNLVFDAPWLKNYRFKAHITVTGWWEAEKGVGSINDQVTRLHTAVTTLGPENVTWRFSPVPMVEDVVQRFDRILAMAAYTGLDRVYLSFLQANDLMPETRTPDERLNILVQLAEVALKKNVKVILCNEDRMLADYPDTHPNLVSGICAPPEDFALPGKACSPSEGCGCVLMADPFTANESCSLNCRYCYAADKSLSSKKHNTTQRSLPVVR